MYLAWSNVTVTTDQQAITRGVQLSMGTPPQIVSLRPSTADDDLYVVNRAQCAPNYNDSCIGSYGGVFDYSTSTTFLEVSQGQWNGTVESNPNQLSFVHFNDLLTLGNASIYGYPAIYDEPGYGGQGVLPLGTDSDLLRIAVEAGAASSTVFGLWTGSRSIDHPIDGSLVLGGYDTTRVEGSLTTFTSQKACEMCVVVSGMTWDDGAGGGSTNLFANSSETFTVNLQPSTNVLYVPQDVWEKFQDATDGVYSSPYLTYASNSTPTGNLTVTFANGYTSSIPAEELFELPRWYDDDGQYVVADDTYTLSTVLNTTGDGYVLDWGLPFLTMNYVIGDYKRAQFHLAPAVRTDFSEQGGSYHLQASCDPTTSSTPTATASSSATAANGGGAAASASGSASATVVKHHSSNTGAIVGGVVGGVLGLILVVGGLALMFYRTRRRNRNAAAAAAAAAPASGPDAGMSQYTGSVADRHSHWTAMSPTEVPSELGNNQKVGPDVHVNQWLSSQASDVSLLFRPPGRSTDILIPSQTQTVTSSTSPNPNTSTMDRPFEMPAQSWDQR
jgi:hypothetical protein